MVVPEPITITLAVVGLLKATWTVSNGLNDFVTGIEKAPKAAVIALTEVRAVTAILRQLQSYLDGKDPAANARASLLTLEEIVATLTDCVCTFSEFENLLNGMKTADMGLIDRFTWNWNKDKVAKIVARIQTQKSSLSTMFAILTCKTQEEAATSSEMLLGLVEKLYEQNSELLMRVRILEGSYTSSSAGTIVAEAVSDSWNVTLKDHLENVVGESSEAPDITMHPAFSAEVVEWLEASRVYRRADNPHIRGSVILDDQSAKLSVLSGISLSEISNISVLALPISTAEIQYSHHYRIEQSYTHRNPVEVTGESDFQYRSLSLGTQPPDGSFGGISNAGPGRIFDQISGPAVETFYRCVKIGLITTKAAVPDLLREGHLQRWWPDLPDPGVGATWRSRIENMKLNSILEFPVIYNAASIYEFNIERSVLEDDWPYLTYVAGEIFDVYGEKGELWLASNQDDPNGRLGWVWCKHFAKLESNHVGIRPRVSGIYSAELESNHIGIMPSIWDDPDDEENNWRKTIENGKSSIAKMISRVARRANREPTWETWTEDNG